MPEPAVKLRDRYRTWRIWQSPQGRWWAVDQQVTWPLLDGCVATLDADDINGLEALLDQQQEQRASATTQPNAPVAVIRATGRGLDQERGP
jgi:hypothetical protein